MELRGVLPAAGLLVEPIDAGDCQPLLHRMGDPLAPLLTTHPGLPRHLFEEVLRTGDPVLMRALSSNRKACATHQDLWEKLATGNNPLAGALWYDQADLEVRRQILAAARSGTAGWTSPAWTADSPTAAPPGLVTRLLETSDMDLLRPAVDCAFPTLLWHILRTGATALSRAEQLRAIRSLHLTGELTTFLMAPLKQLALPADVIELTIEAVDSPDGVERLRLAIERAEQVTARETVDDQPAVAATDVIDMEPAVAATDVIDTVGTEELIKKLYDLAARKADPRWSLEREARDASWNQRGRLDWAAVHAAHQSRPFWPEFLHVLVQRRDCPEQTAEELAMTHPRGLDALVETAWRRRGPISSGTVRALLRTVVTTETLTNLVAQRLGRDISEHDLLTEIRPARTVLKLAQERATASDPTRQLQQQEEEAAAAAERAGWSAFRDRLAHLITDRLAGNVPAWRTLRARLPKFDGSITELIDEALATTASPPGEGWPDAAEVPPFVETPSLHVNRAAFVMLLNSATTENQWRLLPHLDGRTRYDLLARGEWRDEWLTRAVADADRPTLVLLSRHVSLSTEAIEALATLDDPAVNAALIYQRHVTAEQRGKLVAGTPFGPGQTGPLPVDPELREALLGEWSEDWLMPMLHGRDPELASYALWKLSLPQNRVLRVLLHWWERDGRDGLLELLPDTVQQGVRTLVTELVGDPDPANALARLRDAVHQAESPQRAARRLRGGSDPKGLIAEGFRWDWDVLVAEHRINPFDGHTLSCFQRMDDCPPVLREAVKVTVNNAEKRAMKSLASGKSPATVLAKTPLRDRNPWVRHAIHFGELTSVDVLCHGQPAKLVLNSELADEAYRAELAALVRKHLDGRPDAWLLALTLLPDFTGTVPELLQTAALAAS